MSMFPKIKLNIGNDYPPIELQQYKDTDLETESKTVVGAINEINSKCDGSKSDTLAGYGITDAYTKTEVDEQVAGAKKFSHYETEQVKNQLGNYYTKTEIDKMGVGGGGQTTNDKVVIVHAINHSDDIVDDEGNLIYELDKTYEEISELLRNDTVVYLHVSNMSFSSGMVPYSGLAVVDNEPCHLFSMPYYPQGEIGELGGVWQFIISRENKFYTDSIKLPTSIEVDAKIVEHALKLMTDRVNECEVSEVDYQLSESGNVISATPHATWNGALPVDNIIPTGSLVYILLSDYVYHLYKTSSDIEISTDTNKFEITYENIDGDFLIDLQINDLKILENVYMYVIFPHSYYDSGDVSTPIPCSSLEGVIYIEDTNLISGSYTNQLIGGDGSISDGATWVLWDDVLTVPNPTEKITIYRYNNTGASFFAMYDKNGNFIGRTALVAGGGRSIGLLSNTYTVKVVDQITNLTAGQTYSWSEVTHFVPYGAEAGYNFDGNPMYADLKEQIKDLPTKEYIINQANNINEAEFSLYDSEYRSGWLDNSGTFKSLASYRLTEPVFVKASTKIEYRLKHATTAPIIALYSENVIDPSKKIDLVKGINGVSEGEYVVPSDGYICFVTLASYTDGYVKIGQSIFDGIKEYVSNKVQNANNLNLNILCLGDSIFGNDGEIVSYLAQFTGSNVINGAIGGTRASVRVSNADAFQYLDGKNLVQALTSGDWTNQDTAVTTLGGTYPWMQNRIANLKTLDMSKVDLVTMDWGTNDYTGGQTKGTILSAYDYIIDTLQSTYPELRILITTPIWRYFDDTENGDNKVYADATLKEIAEAIETFAKEKRVHILNAYQNMPLSYNTATTYFDTDSGVHLNKKGNEVYAHLLNGKIRSLY